MPFKIQTASVDLINQTANVVAFDQSTQPHVKAINVQFPFAPLGGEGHERDKVVETAKETLRQFLSEI